MTDGYTKHEWEQESDELSIDVAVPVLVEGGFSLAFR